MSISHGFQKRLIFLIENSEFMKSQIPDKSGINYMAFSNAANYGIIPKVSGLIKIADFFNVSIEYLLARTSDEYFNKSKNPTNFYERTKELCDEKTFYKLSQELGFESNYFYKLNSKKYLPALKFLLELSRYFDVSLDYLLGRTDDKYSLKELGINSDKDGEINYE